MTTFVRKSLLDALKLVESGVGGLGCVYLNSKQAFGSVESSNDSLRCFSNVELAPHNTEEAFDDVGVLTNYALLLSAISNAPGETVDITVGNRLTVTSGRFRAEVPILHTQDWFARQKRAITSRFECVGPRLGAALKLCCPAASRETGREQLQCVEFSVSGQKLTVVATTGRAIAVDELECASKTDCSFKIPTEVAEEVGRRAYDSPSLVVAVSQEPASALFSFSDGSTIESALMAEGVSFRNNFHTQLDGRGVHVASAKVNKKRLASALSYGCDIAGEFVQAVTMEITPEGYIKASSTGKEGSFQDEIDCMGSANSGSIKINGGMVEKLIKNFASEDIDVAIHDKGASALFSFGVQQVLVCGMRDV